MSEKNIMIVDTVEALEKRIEEVREAQRIFSTYSQEQVDKIFAAAALAANKARIPLANRQLPKPAWALWKIKSSRTTMLPNTFTMHTKIQRPVALLRRTVLTESSALLNRSVSLPLLFQQQILPQQRSLRL